MVGIWQLLTFPENSIIGKPINVGSSWFNSPFEYLVFYLAIDVWEHAYYIDYKNVRLDYVKQIWKIVNWKDAERRFLAVAKKWLYSHLIYNLSIIIWELKMEREVKSKIMVSSRTCIASKPNRDYALWNVHLNFIFPRFIIIIWVIQEAFPHRTWVAARASHPKTLSIRQYSPRKKGSIKYWSKQINS